jgi:hypothetical protein
MDERPSCQPALARWIAPRAEKTSPLARGDDRDAQDAPTISGRTVRRVGRPASPTAQIARELGNQRETLGQLGQRCDSRRPRRDGGSVGPERGSAGRTDVESMELAMRCHVLKSSSTPAVDRDLVAEAPRTVGRADEINLRQRGRPFPSPSA